MKKILLYIQALFTEGFLVKGFCLLTVLCFSSCSLLKVDPGTNDLLGGYKRFTQEDYLKSLEILVDSYLKSNKDKVVSFPPAVEQFLNKVVGKIEKNNELFLTQKINYKFYVVKDVRNFYFSMPGGNIFFSLGLLKKHLRNEEFFSAVLTNELIKQHLHLFKKEIAPPLGEVKVEKLIAISILGTEMNLELSKHSYVVLERSGIDPFAQLMWLQTKNKNAIDFTLLYRNTSEIALEEQGLKTFIIEREREIKVERDEKNSSKQFYQLLNFVDGIRV
jgi:hypothetical protein